MPRWTKEYFDSLVERFAAITADLDDRLDDIADGRVAPSVDDIAIGSARHVRAAVLFFDIEGFSKRTASPSIDELRKTLFMLDCVIPMIMKVIHDYGGYVEKNTGDGVMAVIGVEQTDSEAAKSALEIAVTVFYVLDALVNPYLESNDIDPVNARIGIDIGSVLLARIGLPTGLARQERSFLTAVGPAANLANRLQGLAGTNEVWVGDLVARSAPEEWQSYFIKKTPDSWIWSYVHNSDLTYDVWHFKAERPNP